MDWFEIILKDIALPVNSSPQEAVEEAGRRLKNIFPSALSKVCPSKLSVYRRSVDCRRGRELRLVYSVRALVSPKEYDEKKAAKINAGLLLSSEIKIEKGNAPLSSNPVIVGFGPSGMFAALLLAENGYNPIVIERGGNIEERTEKVERFYRERILDKETNIQFGAGGAGTFSDGKLVTRVNDPYTRYVLDRFCEFGAPPDILTNAKPHIGTDLLRKVVDRIEKRITERGGKIEYNTRLEKIKENKILTSKGEMPYGALVLAIGNSACDTAEMIIKSSFESEAKTLSVGLRIEHLQEDIDGDMYGKYAGHPNLPRASYSLSRATGAAGGRDNAENTVKNDRLGSTFRAGRRAAYTFCMCPGGEVVASSSAEEQVSVNGMSRYARDGKNANSAVLVTLFPEDFSNDIFKIIDFQRNLEKVAYKYGGADYSAPISTFGRFIYGLPFKIGRVEPSYMGGNAYRECEIENILPEFICSHLKEGLVSFASIMPSFASKDAILTGTETRTSSPWRFLRDSETLLAKGKDNIYPCGEGAGYAGGITSAALDGIKTALAVMKRYKPWRI